MSASLGFKNEPFFNPKILRENGGKIDDKRNSTHAFLPSDRRHKTRVVRAEGVKPTDRDCCYSSLVLVVCASFCFISSDHIVVAK